MDFFLDKVLLFPYYITLKIRHWLYDTGRKKSVSYDVPVICVGNVTVGGTGKTPHTEMLIRMLEKEYRIAVVSRGYRRKTNGYREVLPDDDYRDVGDEPLQIKRKFPSVRVAVDSDRCRAIDMLMALREDERPTLVILDDGFQHRRIVPKLNIVLVRASRPVYEDHLLPFGRLRDLPGQLRRADIVAVTKVSAEVNSDFVSSWRNRLRLSERQSLFVTGLSYEKILPVFPSEVEPRYEYAKSAVLFSGIADDTSFRNYVNRRLEIKYSVSFPDHHNFKTSDFRSLSMVSDKFYTSVVITTEKDAQRIFRKGDSVPESLKKRMFCLPVKPEVLPVIQSESDIDFDYVIKKEYDRLKQEILCRLS